MFLRKTRKPIAVFFLLLIIHSTLAPSLSYALTAGPTAPEFSSFEPVDTTDLVNLLSGDLAYNLPLLEVPGPAGGYPFSLSYHAGIQPNEEASWVGLGFTLNPGSITRNVNGYPDDHKEITDVDRVYWEGGERTKYSAGVSLGLANSPASVNFGLSYSQDTYLGYGVGWYLGFSASGAVYGKKFGSLGLQGGATMNVDPYTGVSGGAGIGIGAKLAQTVNANVSYGTFGLNSSVSAGLGSTQASISSQDPKVSLTVGGGYSRIQNSKAGNISTSSSGFGCDIPVYPGIAVSLGYNYTRYWSDETASIKTNGALYYPTASVSNFDQNAFDSYALPDPELNGSNANPEFQAEGSFPNYDNYYVVAQGVSGTMRPHIYKGLIFRQNIKIDGRYEVKQYKYSNSDYQNDKIEFRFNNDFSNKYIYDKGEVVDGTTVPVNAKFESSQKTGEHDNDGFYDGHLAGSQHIEWYTNNQIIQGIPDKNPRADGFREYNGGGFNRSVLPAMQIGGYMITNSSGVTYHYALPVYTFNEVVYSENVNKDKGNTFNSLKRPTKYAYQWLLTAVTGPDYVDNNFNGLADKGDVGYWVNFTYTKYASDYNWRNPGESYHIDLDNNFKNYSSGQKEVYYLESVRTASHIAVFQKSVRFDSREVTNITEGGFEPRTVTQKHPSRVICEEQCKSQYCSDGNCTNAAYTTCMQGCADAFPDPIQVKENSKSALRLDRINLYRVDDYDGGKAGLEYTIRSIDFSYDYSLAPETPNSYDFTSYSNKLGKLTLNTVKFVGKNRVSLIPPIVFSYDINESINTDAYIYSVDGSRATISIESGDISLTSKLAGGDIIKFFQAGQMKYALVRGTVPKAGGAAEMILQNLGSNPVTTGAMTSIVKTKNPPYGKNKYDIWNMYKANADDAMVEKDVNSGRLVDPVSSRATDAWSLRTITNSLGSTTVFEYESDDYSTVVLNQAYHFQIASAYVQSNKTYLRLWDDVEVNKVFKVGDPLNTLIVYNRQTGCEGFNPQISELQNTIQGFGSDNSVIIPTALQFVEDPACPGSNNFLAGHLGSSAPLFHYGGGIRVKSIKLISSTGTSITTYSYQDPANESSGVTSYEPYTLGASVQEEVTMHGRARGVYSATDRYGDGDYMKKLFKGFSKLMPLGREVPAPGVMYKHVTVKDSFINPDGHKEDMPDYSAYEFEVFDKDQVQVNAISNDFRDDVSGSYDGINYASVRKKNIVVEDYTSRIGSLKKHTRYNRSGSVVSKVAETTYGYLHDATPDDNRKYFEKLSAFNHQGLIQETFIDIKFRDQIALWGLVSRRHQYPNIRVSETNVNYLTGIKSVTRNLAFDFYAGNVSKQLNYDSYGNAYLTESEAAYHHYANMGFKVLNNTNRNMLTQNGASYSYVVDKQKILNNDPSGKTGLLTAGIQTWSDRTPVIGLTNQPGIWRMSSSFLWNGNSDLQSDGSYPIDGFSPYQFNAISDVANANWLRTSQITLYDAYSHALEAKDVNGNYAATIMDIAQQKVIASAAPASYQEIACSGAENLIGTSGKDGGVARGDGNPSASHSHTGKYSLLVGSGAKGFNYTLNAATTDLSKKYRASVWVYAPGYAETQTDLNKIELYYKIGELETKVSPVLQKNKSKSWYLLNIDINPSAAGQVYVGVRNNSQRGVYFDDFRVHPLDASMTSYVYDPVSDEVSYILDNKNLYTHYEYDAMGRVIRITRENLNFDFGNGKETFKADRILQEMHYNYGPAH